MAATACIDLLLPNTVHYDYNKVKLETILKLDSTTFLHHVVVSRFRSTVDLVMSAKSTQTFQDNLLLLLMYSKLGKWIWGVAFRTAPRRMMGEIGQ